MSKDSTKVKVTGNRTTYKPIEMTDKSVFDLARHWHTFAEICDQFHVSSATLEAKHGPAFRAGKAAAAAKPRMLLDRLFTEFQSLPSLVEPTLVEVGQSKTGDPIYKPVPVDLGALLKAIEIHARKYEDYGQPKEPVKTPDTLTAEEVNKRLLELLNRGKT